MVKKAICLISGGLDSCVATCIAKEKGFQIYALTFSYEQLHTKELQCAQAIVKQLQIKQHIIIPIPFQKFCKSSLLQNSEIPLEANTLDTIGSVIPSTYVPARNTIFLSIALGYAESIDAHSIFIGANAVDYSGYPDCRPHYFSAFQKMADLATKRGVQGRSIKIETPLLHMSKAMIIQTGVKLQAPIAKTWSCYQGKTYACGRCDSCLLRLKGFQDARVHDPLTYQEYPVWYTQ